MTPFPRLKEPPIIEVVCGLSFAAVDALDAMTIGRYWAANKRDAYPHHQLQPPVLNERGFSFSEGVGPIRCWLIDADDQYVIQIQPDRFYFNWRKRKHGYPHFNDYDRNRGVLSRGLAEFEDLKTFCRTELGTELQPQRLELAKTDLLLQGTEHFSAFADLAKLLPAVKPLAKFTQSKAPMLDIKLFEARDDHDVHFALTNAVAHDTFAPAIQLDTRITSTLKGDLRPRFLWMNDRANEVFFSFIDQNEIARFGGEAP